MMCFKLCFIFGVLFVVASSNEAWWLNPFKRQCLVEDQCFPALDSSSHCSPQPGCKNPPTFPASLSVVFLLSPLFELVTTNNSLSQGVDNVCYTFFPITSTNFLLFRSIVFSNGTNQVQAVVESDFPGCPGLLRGNGLNNAEDGSSTLVYNEYTLGVACASTFVTYRCQFIGQGKNTDDPVPYCTAISADTELTPLCRAGVELVTGLRETCGNNELLELPNLLNKKCVTSFNNASCINADKIDPQDAISFPIGL